MSSELKPKIRFKGFTDVWEQRKLFGSAEYIDGNYGESYPKDSEFVENGIPFFTSAVTGSQGIWNYKYVKYITEEKNSTLIKAQSKGGDLVLTNRGASMGVVSQIPLHYRDVNIGPQLTRIRGKEKILDNLFLLSNLKTKKCYEQLLASNAGSAMPFISLTNLSNLDISVPNYNEQIKIGILFQNLDNLITLHQRKYDKLIELKKSLLEKMFPQNNSVIPEIRFKGFTDDWEQRKLSDNLKNIQTGTNLLGSINNLGTPLLKMGNIQRGYFTTDKLEYLKDYSSIEKENIANFGDFFFNTRNTLELVGKGATWFGMSGKYAFNSNIARFTFEGINTTFFNYLYNTESLLKQVHSRATGTTSVAAIYPQSLNTIEYMLPSYDEQSKIGNLLLDLDNLITLHQRKHDKLNKIKQSLLNDMFV